MTEFEPGSSAIGSERSANCATTTAHLNLKVCSSSTGYFFGVKLLRYARVSKIERREVNTKYWTIQWKV